MMLYRQHDGVGRLITKKYYCEMYYYSYQADRHIKILAWPFDLYVFTNHKHRTTGTL